MKKVQRTTIHITIHVHSRRGKTKPRQGFSSVPPWLAAKVSACNTLNELQELFFSVGKKSRATLDAFIQRREALEFHGGKPNHSPLNKHQYGSSSNQ